jgi:glycosyltransferase involved in cell wall biosynthesis
VPGLRVCYITYDGLTDPLGGSQILPYLAGLSARGHRIAIVSCEKPERLKAGRAAVETACRKAGIDWYPLTYHKRPPILSTLYDLERLSRTVRRLHDRHKFDLVHCRSYVPALAGLALKRRRGVPFLFDMRGFWADERVEGGLWPQSNPVFRAVYRAVKRLETALLRGADHIVSLTEAGKDALLGWPVLAARRPAITVIPCCVDFGHFPIPAATDRAAARARLGIADAARVAAYLGSVGTWYMLPEMLDFFRRYRAAHAGARFLFVTQDDPGAIREEAARRGVEPEALAIVPASRDEVPGLMAAADLGLFFIKPVFSKTASSPTKMGEMLALGLPIVTNGPVGDVEAIVAATGTGIVVTRYDDRTYDEAIRAAEAIRLSPGEIRDRALPWFDAEMGVERYDRVYRETAGR